TYKQDQTGVSMPLVRDPIEPKISLWHLLAFYLRFLREKEGLSLTQCGKIIGVARSTVSNIEAVRQRPQEDQLAKLDHTYSTGGRFRGHSKPRTTCEPLRWQEVRMMLMTPWPGVWPANKPSLIGTSRRSST